MQPRAENSKGALEEFLDTTLRLLHASMGNMQVIDGNGDLRMIAHRGFERPFLDFFERVVPNKRGASCGHAGMARVRVVVDDVVSSPIFVGTPSVRVLLDAGVRSCQSIPLITSTDIVVGVVSTHYPGRPYPPGSDALKTLGRLTQQAADLMSQMRVQEPDTLLPGRRTRPLEGEQPSLRAHEDLRRKVLDQLDQLLPGSRRSFADILSRSGASVFELTSALEDLIADGLVARTSDGFVTLYSRTPRDRRTV